MKLGINTYTYMWSIGFKGAAPKQPLTALGLLEKARELGVRVVQVGPNLPLDKLPAAELDAFVRQAGDWGIELELGTRGIEPEHVRLQVELARRIGATLLRTIPEVGGQAPPTADIPSLMRQSLPLLESAGVRLGLENGKIPAAELRDVIEQVASPYVGVILDTVNSLAVPEGWRHVTETLAPYVNCLHLKEFIVQRAWHMMGFTVEGRPAGQGQLDVPWLLRTLETSGARGYNVILESWPPEQKTLEESIVLEQAWAVESVGYLRRYIKD